MQAKPLNGVYYEVVGGLEEDEIIEYDTCEKTEKEMKEYAWDTERTCFLRRYENGILVEQTLITGDISYEKTIGNTYYYPLPSEMRFRYSMLSRLKSDCDYFLGIGGRYVNQLWAGSVYKQIEEMRNRWLEFKEDEKPEWLTWEDINNYETEMNKAFVESCNVNSYRYRVVFQTGNIQYCDTIEDVYKVLEYCGLKDEKVVW